MSHFNETAPLSDPFAPSYHSFCLNTHGFICRPGAFSFYKHETNLCLSPKHFRGIIILQAGKNFIQSFLNRQTGQAVCFVFKRKRRADRGTHLDGRLSAIFRLETLTYTKYACGFSPLSDEKIARQSARFDPSDASCIYYLSPVPVLSRERGFCHSGFFLICAQRRGYFFGVGPVFRMTTAQWCRSVPGIS